MGAKAPSLLSGLIFDGDGNRMTPTHANKSGRRYRYYISASLLDRGKPGAGTMRVPASEVCGLTLLWGRWQTVEFPLEILVGLSTEGRMGYRRFRDTQVLHVGPGR